MTYKTRFTDGALTVGETRTAVAIATGMRTPSDVEAFVIVAFNHIDKEHHELMIVSDRGKDRKEIDAILYLARRATLAETTQDHKPPDSIATWLRFAFGRLGQLYSKWQDTSVGSLHDNRARIDLCVSVFP